MTIRLAQDYGKWKKGEVISLHSSLSERLIGQGKAVPVKAPPSLYQGTAHQPPASAETRSAEPGALERSRNAEHRARSERCEGLQEEAFSPSVQAMPDHLQDGGLVTPEAAGRKRQKKETPSASFVGTSLTEGGSHEP